MTEAERDEYPNREQGKRMLEAIGDLAVAICPHNMDRDRRDKVRVAIGTLIDEVLLVASASPQRGPTP